MRTRNRTDYLSPHVCQQVLTLFGTISNSHQRLSMHPMSMSTFHAALSGYPVTPETADVIGRRWLQWCSKFGLKPLDGPSSELPFTLNGNPWATDASDITDPD